MSDTLTKDAFYLGDDVICRGNKYKVVKVTPKQAVLNNGVRLWHKHASKGQEAIGSHADTWSASYSYYYFATPERLAALEHNQCCGSIVNTMRVFPVNSLHKATIEDLTTLLETLKAFIANHQ